MREFSFLDKQSHQGSKNSFVTLYTQRMFLKSETIKVVKVVHQEKTRNVMNRWSCDTLARPIK